MKLNWITAHRRLLKLVWAICTHGRTAKLRWACSVLNILSAVRPMSAAKVFGPRGQKTPFMPFIAMPTAATRRFGAIPASPWGHCRRPARTRGAGANRTQYRCFREGFWRAAMPPSDVDNLIWLFVEFRDDEDISHVARLWREGDRPMDELNQSPSAFGKPRPAARWIWTSNGHCARTSSVSTNRSPR